MTPFYRTWHETASHLASYEFCLNSNIKERQNTDHNDLLSDLIRGLLHDQDQDTPKALLPYIAANAIMLLAGGYKTATNLISQSVIWLGRVPEQRRLLEDNPTLIGAVIDEVMRLAGSSQYVARQALQDITLAHACIHQGQHVLILLAAANLDEQVFPQPLEFSLTRKAQKKHLGFGLGPHFCIGAPVVAQMSRI